jgi:hypothetical protein
MSINDLAVQWGPLLLLPLFIGFGLWRLYQAYSMLFRRTAEDISDRNVPPPPATLLLVNQLSALGFHRLGEIEFRWLDPRIKPDKEWVFANEDGEVVAEVSTIASVNPAVFLTTQFSDGAQIETGFPYGMNLNEVDYQAHALSTSLEKGYQYHLAQVQQQRKIHGAPEKIDHMDGAFRVDERRRIKFNRYKLKTLFWRSYAPIMSIGVAVPVGFYGERLAILAGAPANASIIIGVGISLAPLIWIYANYWKLKSPQPKS